MRACPFGLLIYYTMEVWCQEGITKPENTVKTVAIRSALWVLVWICPSIGGKIRLSVERVKVLSWYDDVYVYGPIVWFLFEKYGIQSIPCYGQLVCPTFLLLLPSLIIQGHSIMSQIRCLGTTSGIEHPWRRNVLFQILRGIFGEKETLIMLRRSFWSL